MQATRLQPRLLILVWLIIPAVLQAVEPPIWCVYPYPLGDLGTWEKTTVLVLYTNGVYKACKGSRAMDVKRSNSAKQSQYAEIWLEMTKRNDWFYEDRLTEEQRRHLEMWLEATDFIHRERGMEARLCSEMVLYQETRTNSAYIRSEDLELGHIDFFLLRLVWHAEGPPYFNGEVKIDRPLGYPPERPVSLLKAFIAGPSTRVDLKSEAIRFLSKFLPPEQWSEFLAQSFEAAPEAKRRVLQEAVTSETYSLKTRVSEQHWKALKAEAARWRQILEK